MKIRTAIMKKPSMKNMKFLQKAKAWTPGKSKTVGAEEQDGEKDCTSYTQPALLKLPYESSANGESTTLTNPFVHHRMETGPSTALAESEQETLPQSPSATTLLKSPLPKLKHARSVKKVASFLRPKKAKNSPASSSPSPSPIGLEQIAETTADNDNDDNPSPRTSRSSTTNSPSALHSPTNSTLHSPATQTFTLTTTSSPPTPPPTWDPTSPETSSTNQQIRALKISHIATSNHTTPLTPLHHLHAQNTRLATAQHTTHDTDLHKRIVHERIRTLKHARTILHRPGNPFFTPASTREREKRDALRRARWAEALRRRVTVCVALPACFSASDTKAPPRVVERAKYQFESESEGEGFEGEMGEGW